MTLRARLVLFDAEAAVAELPGPDEMTRHLEGGYERRKIYCALSLLRSVGLVLKGVDHKHGDQYLKQAINDKWRELKATKPKPDVFHNFVDKLRADAVHYYDFPEGEPEICMGIAYPTYEYDDAEAEMIMPPKRKALEAIDFWKNYLDEVDALAAQFRANDH